MIKIMPSTKLKFDAKCIKCSIDFKYCRPRDFRNGRKFCSAKCYMNSREIINNPTLCKGCNLEFINPHSQIKKFCSGACRLNFIKTDLNKLYNERVIKNDGDTCWGWSGNKNCFGYGILRKSKKQIKAHRLSWIINNGAIENGKNVLHHCDNPPCTRIEHLYLGTQKDNARDMVERERHNSRPLRGEDSGFAKLKTEDVIEIKKMLKSGIKRIKIASKFNVTTSAINHIYHRRTWSHIKD